MTISFVNDLFPTQRINRAVIRILDNVRLCSMATLGGLHEVHINTAFFSFTEDLLIVFLSDPATQHCRNIDLNRRVALSIFNTDHKWGAPLSGIQMFGVGRRARGKEVAIAETSYARRFPEYRHFVESLGATDFSQPASRFYLFKADRLKMLMEPEFGEEVYVDATIVRRNSDE